MRAENRMIALIGAALIAMGAQAHAVQIYDADFSINGIGWTHTTSSPAPAAPNSAAGANWTIGYNTAPSTDGSTNSFITDGGALTSSDWGGAGYFQSSVIDVSTYDTIDISFLGATVGSAVFNNPPTEFFRWSYTIDGGTPVTASTTSDGSLDQLFSGIDVTGASSLTVGFDFNIDGGGDGFSMTSITVEGSTGGPGPDPDPDPTPGSVMLFSETFETDGEGTRYTVGPDSGMTSTQDYWDRVNNSNSDRSYTNVQGTWYFGGQDISGAIGSVPGTLLIEDIDIEGYENLAFSGFFAEQRPEASSADDIDASDFAIIEYQIDDGGWMNLLHFQNDGSTFNTTFLEDTDFDGTGDGTQLETAFAEFLKSIAGTGSLLDLRFTVSVDSGDEDFAFDSLTITGDLIEVGGDPGNEIPTPAAIPAGLALVGLIAGRRRRR